MSYIDELYEKIEMFIENNLDEYVLSIDGNWGSGKTYAINKVIESYNKKNEKKMKYISLNGIEYLSLSNLGIEKFSIMDALEIPALIADNLLPVNASNILEKTKDTFKKEKVKHNIKVIVFDDIERCKCDIDSILGFIDQIKNNGIKVIAVLNSDKIKSENKEIYEKIKEKIIGTIIKWNASDEVINDFIKNIEIENFDKENIKLLKTCLEELYSQFFINNNGEKDINLRLLKKVIIHTCYIIKHLNWNKNIGQNYKCAYIEIIKNVYVHFHKETYEGFKDDSDLITNTSKKLKSSIYITKIDLLFVEDYFNNGLYVNKGKYEKELKLLLEDDKEEFNLKYNKLYSSAELASFYNKIKNDLLANKYPIYSYSNIIRSILTIDFYNKSNYLKEITDIMCNKIENNTEVIYNFDIHYQISEKQNKYILNVKKALGKSNKEISLQLFKKYIENLSSNMFSEFYEIISKNNYCEKQYEILEDIDIYKFLSQKEIWEKYYYNKNYDSKIIDFIYFLFRYKDRKNEDYIKQVKKIISILNTFKKSEQDFAKKMYIDRHINDLKYYYKI